MGIWNDRTGLSFTLFKCGSNHWRCVKELWTKDHPYKHIASEAGVILAISNNSIPPQPTALVTAVDTGMWVMCEHCWEVSPIYRPYMSQILDALQHLHSVCRATWNKWHTEYSLTWVKPQYVTPTAVTRNMDAILESPRRSAFLQTEQRLHTETTKMQLITGSPNLGSQDTRGSTPTRLRGSLSNIQSSLTHPTGHRSKKSRGKKPYDTLAKENKLPNIRRWETFSIFILIDLG